MFTIRPDQMKTFEQAAARDFESRLAAYLHSRLPDSPLPHLQDLITQGLVIARQFNITTESNTARLIVLIAEFCPGFARNGLSRPAQNALLKYRATEQQRLDAFQQAIQE